MWHWPLLSACVAVAMWRLLIPLLHEAEQLASLDFATTPATTSASIPASFVPRRIRKNPQLLPFELSRVMSCAQTPWTSTTVLSGNYILRDPCDRQQNGEIVCVWSFQRHS